MDGGARGSSFGSVTVQQRSSTRGGQGGNQKSERLNRPRARAVRARAPLPTGKAISSSLKVSASRILRQEEKTCELNCLPTDSLKHSFSKRAPV